jgi:hypothetical protein
LPPVALQSMPDVNSCDPLALLPVLLLMQAGPLRSWLRFAVLISDPVALCACRSGGIVSNTPTDRLHYPTPSINGTSIRGAIARHFHFRLCSCPRCVLLRVPVACPCLLRCCRPIFAAAGIALALAAWHWHWLLHTLATFRSHRSACRLVAVFAGAIGDAGATKFDAASTEGTWVPLLP